MSTTVVRPATERPRPCLSLASVRERIGITLEEVAQSTRIAPHYLCAIETEEFTKLPAGVYATSYIRQYARAIGYSETALLDHYRARAEEEPEAEPLPTVADQRGPRVTTRLGAAVCTAMDLFRWRPPIKPRTGHPV
jgi:cytoskeleton protein RodZ